ncbi:E3 ubiquitin-protein ligase TRIM71 [Stylophora pistillata]|uniref:E3 ubiquitin-protein ligase TRIM71 n=1 Tax=Stylophora pistillata TaxID=50429 RepID=A0A2B4S2D9_STYPI|nr:E3 ubiquitin-protein ligase TRIM71 [Stylophora pistillata]
MCQVPVCQNCVTLQHSTHDVEHLEPTVQALKSDIDCKLDSVKKSCQRFSDYIRELNEKCSLTDRRRQIVKEKIQETFKSLIVTLQEQERDLVTQVEKQSNETQEELMKHKREFQEKLSKSEEAISYIERFVERTTGAELVTTKTVIDELFQQLGEPQEMPLPAIEKKSLTVFLKNHEVLKGLQTSGIGHLHTTTTETDVKQCLVGGYDVVTAGLETKFEAITRNSAGEQLYSSADDIVVEIVDSQHGEPVAELNVVDQIDGRYEISFIPSRAKQHVVTVEINGETVRDLLPIHVRERTFKPIVHFGELSIDEKKLSSPWGVTVSNSNDIFVSDMDNNRILVFNDEGNFVWKFGEKFLEEPTGISVDDNGRIFVANRASNNILIFAPDGEYVSTVNIEGLLKNPRGICFDSQGNLIVCDSGNKCVRIVSVQGKVLKTVGEGCFRMPFDCVYYEDKIFVSDREGHKVKIYNKDGQLSHEFGGRGTRDGELYHPTGLAVDKTGHLLVSSEHSHKGIIQSKSGDYVRYAFYYDNEEIMATIAAPILGDPGAVSRFQMLKSTHCPWVSKDEPFPVVLRTSCLIIILLCNLNISLHPSRLKMDVPTLMHNLREEVTCSVCIHLFKEPKQLPCLHIFCLECLNGLARTNARQGKIKCPLCQIEVAVPDNGLMETLPDCFYLKNLLDILAIKECNTSKVTCGNCDKKSDEASYCFHCSKFWCKECLIAHNILKEYKEHRVLSLKDFQKEDFEDVIRRPAFCPKDFHERKVLKFYCKVCQVPVCKNCLALEHCKHDVEPLEKVFTYVKNSIASKLEDTKKLSDTIAKHVREREEEGLLLENRSQTIKLQIQQTVKNIVQTLQEQERGLVTDVENQTKEAQEKLMKEKEELRDHLSRTEDIVSQVTRLLKRSTGAEIVRTKTSVDEIFQGLNDPPEIPLSRNIKILQTVFLKNQEILDRLKEEKLGRLFETGTAVDQSSLQLCEEATAGLESKFKVITRNSLKEQYYCPGDYITAEINSAQSRKTAADVRIIDENDGSYAISFIPSEAGQHLVTVTVNGEKLKEFPPIDVRERTFKHIGFMVLKHDVQPWGVTVNNLDEIFVTDIKNNRILVLDKDGQFIRSFGQNQVNSPTGVWIDNEGRSYVANRGSNKISLFHQNGELISAVPIDGSLRNPRGICFDPMGNLVVCDAGNKCVKIFSPDSNILRTVGKCWLQMPFDCLCYDFRIFVSDRDAHLVKVYNEKGQFLYEFGRFGTGAGELNHPTGLAVDKTGHLLVCCENHDAVQIFTLNGQFVGKFAGDESDLRQIKRRTSLTVLKSGRIIVCEFDNYRLQILA